LLIGFIISILFILKSNKGSFCQFPIIDCINIYRPDFWHQIIPHTRTIKLFIIFKGTSTTPAASDESEVDLSCRLMGKSDAKSRVSELSDETMILVKQFVSITYSNS